MGRKNLLLKAREKVKEILETHTVPPLPKDSLKELKEIVKSG